MLHPYILSHTHARVQLGSGGGAGGGAGILPGVPLFWCGPKSLSRVARLDAGVCGEAFLIESAIQHTTAAEREGPPRGKGRQIQKEIFLGTTDGPYRYHFRQRTLCDSQRSVPCARSH